MHNHIWKQGLEYDIVISSRLIDMYIEFHFFLWDRWNGHGDTKERITWKIVLWTTLISGYIDNGWGEYALIWHSRMHSEGNIQIILARWRGIESSWIIIKVFQLCTAMMYDMYMYFRCGNGEETFTVLQHNRDVLSYNTIISKYV